MGFPAAAQILCRRQGLNRRGWGAKGGKRKSQSLETEYKADKSAKKNADKKAG